jgi:hypothetical protein
MLRNVHLPNAPGMVATAASAAVLPSGAFLGQEHHGRGENITPFARRGLFGQHLAIKIGDFLVAEHVVLNDLEVRLDEIGDTSGSDRIFSCIWRSRCNRAARRSSPAACLHRGRSRCLRQHPGRSAQTSPACADRPRRPPPTKPGGQGRKRPLRNTRLIMICLLSDGSECREHLKQPLCDPGHLTGHEQDTR